MAVLFTLLLRFHVLGFDHEGRALVARRAGFVRGDRFYWREGAGLKSAPAAEFASSASVAVRRALKSALGDAREARRVAEKALQVAREAERSVAGQLGLAPIIVVVTPDTSSPPITERLLDEADPLA